jgi:hypothetical protein
MIVGIELNEREAQHKEKNHELMDKIMGKIKNIGM